MIPVIFGLAGLTLSDEERGFFREVDPAGYILFGRNVASRTQLAALTAALRAIHGREALLICVDQEGGRVARMRPPQWPAYPAGEAFARLWEVAPASAIAAAYANAEALGRDLAEVGISVDCWPCVDLRHPGGHDVIGDRALGKEPRAVAALARAVLEGLAAAGVAGVIKHMPGHGRAMVDSHRALPTITASAEELAADIAPFRTLCASEPGAPACPRIGMTGHLLLPAWDADTPATLSPTIITEVIRGAIGFDGLLITDDIDMAALPGTVVARAMAALAAGCDVVLNCWARMAEMRAIAAAVPMMPALSRQRLDHALAGTRVPTAPDPAAHAALIATRDALLALVEDEVEGKVGGEVGT